MTASRASEELEGRRRLNELLKEALEVEGEARRAFVAESCGEDGALRERLERMIASAEETGETFLAAGAVLEGPLWDDSDDPDTYDDDDGGLPSALSPGERVGAYRVVEEIGRGGMAVVYLAERADGHFEQWVALKVLKRGTDSGEVLRRFARERQILASLDHPNIARLLDGGVTADGRPFFALEHVEGLPVDRYCDHHRLSIEARLRLFLEIARGVGAAHRRLVVHRDLKPSNILVADGGRVRLLDFGIAKLLDPEAGADTRTELRLMTPEFASPEQWRGELVTTATDIYQLGAILYLMLVGFHPHRVRERTSAAVARAVVEREPWRPSTAVLKASQLGEDSVGTQELAALRATRPERLGRLLAGDLDNIVMKALRKEPEQRYRSADRLMDDIERHLEGRPVTARPASVRYHASKFLRRHRLAAAVVLTAMLSIVALVTFYTRELAQERDRARREAEKANQVATALAGFFQDLDPYGGSGGVELTARDLLEQGRQRLEATLGDQPAVRAELQALLADIYLNLGSFEESRALFDQALQAQEQLLSTSDLALARTRVLAARHAIQVSEFRRARELLDQALTVQEATLQALSRDLPNAAQELELELALSLELASQLDTAYHNFNSALARGLRSLNLREKALGADHPKVADSRMRIATALQEMGNAEGAKAHLSHALEIQERAYGPDHPQIGTTLRRLGNAYAVSGEPQAALPYLERSLKVLETRLGPDHIEVSSSQAALSLTLADLGDLERAVTLQRQALEISERQFGAESANSLVRASDLAYLLVQAGSAEEAIPLYRRILKGMEAALGADNPTLVGHLEDLAEALEASGDSPQAQALRARAAALSSSLTEPSEAPVP